MAGMFYSLQEAAQKLNKTEEEVKQLAKDGKLREFRDGSNLLFKIDEVEALMSDTSAMGAISTPEEQPVEPQEPAELQELTSEPQQEPDVEEPEAEGTEVEQPEEKVEQAEQEPLSEPEQVSELEQTSEPEEASLQEEPPEEHEIDETAQLESITEEPEDEEISLAPETTASAFETDLTDVDTALTGEGINVLGEKDRDYEVTDDTMSETIGPSGTKDEASLEELEEDVNLDSFGSGSGLLDLSLQADDTSLGGILDEIYTTEGGEAEQEQPEPSAEVGAIAEAEPMFVEEELAPSQPTQQISPVTTAYVEPAPDIQSNTFGILLFLPLLILLYTAVVTVAAQRGVIPSILKVVQGLIWPIMIGAVVVAGIVVGAAFILGGTPTKGAPKAKKSKKAKKPKKPKKSKKAKTKEASNQ